MPLEWTDKRIYVAMAVEWQKAGSTHILAGWVYIHSIVQSDVVLQSQEPGGVVSFLQVYLSDEFQSVARWTSKGQFQFEILLHHFVVYEVLFESFHLIGPDMVDVDAY